MNNSFNRYISTRGSGREKSFIEVLLAGMALDGGLYVPVAWPKINIASLVGLPYHEAAYLVVKSFVGDEIPDEDLKTILRDVYGENFRHPAVAPLVQLEPSLWIMELFHGPTLAFKDVALQLLGRLFDYVLGKRGERTVIVGATSGDTGSAAIEACRLCGQLDIFILHPHGRTSEVQRRQMTSVEAKNVHNIAIEGTFDDCQDIVKALFADAPFRDTMNLSAVNSINWVRIMAQIVYYMTAGAALNAMNHPLSFAVPTGNFGNVYAAYAASQMGLPIERLIIGSNRNDILTRFFETGTMSASGVEPSLSPSMDIQVSSNFERYLFDLLGRDAGALREKMVSFRQGGSFAVTPDELQTAQKLFTAVRCSDDETLATMADCYKETGYLLDPHSAVGLHAAKASGVSATIVSLACAHPAKFPDAVLKATGIHPPLPAHLADLYDREERLTVLPNDVSAVKKLIISHV